MGCATSNGSRLDDDRLACELRTITIVKGCQCEGLISWCGKRGAHR